MDDSTPNDNLREEFNRWVADGRAAHLEESHLPITLPVLDLMRIQPDDNVLDLGCGEGWLVRLLAERVPEGRVVGVDISDEMIRRARRKHVDLENAMFVLGASDEIPWDANVFTRAISVESAYYWPDPARGVAEIFRVLREGGSGWILINYHGENPHTDRWAANFSTPAHLLSAAQWESLFGAAGFTGVASRRIPDPTPAPQAYSGRWFRDAEQLRAFRAAGALLVHGTK